MSGSIEGRSTRKRKLIVRGGGSSDGGGASLMDQKERGKENVSDENGDTEKAPINPMLVDLILDRVFIYIINSSQETGFGVAKNVQSCRLVCKLWNDRTTHLYRQERAPLEFGCDSAVLNFGHEDFPDSPEMALRRFLCAIKKSDLIPAECYKLKPSIFCPGNQSLIEEFMRKCGPGMTKLHLFVDDFSSFHLSEKTFSPVNFDKLHTLEIQFVRIGETRENVGLPQILQFLLKSAPNLHSISIGGWSCECQRQREAEISLMGMWPLIPVSIRRLCLTVPFLSDAYFGILAQKKLKLEACKIVYGKSMNMDVNLCKFLKSQSKTLKNMFLFSNTTALTSPNFPQMEELTNLDLDLNIDEDESSCTLSAKSFTDTFPKLAVLDIRDFRSQSACEELLSCKRPAATVEKLFFPCGFPQSHLVKKAALTFPNVKSLYVTRTTDIRDTLPQVFEHFVNLENLVIDFYSYETDLVKLNGDSLFSGVSEYDCERIMSQGRFESVNLEEFHRAPSILNLKKLKSLVMKRCDATIFTDFSAHFSFSKMESLEHLRSDRFMMSPTAMGMLRRSMKTLKVARFGYENEKYRVDYTTYLDEYDGSNEVLDRISMYEDMVRFRIMSGLSM